MQEKTLEVWDMLFRKKIERSCNYCAHSARLENEDVICSKRGICNEEQGCRKFRYDPCKRIPFKAKAVDFTKFKDSDFSLE